MNKNEKIEEYFGEQNDGEVKQYVCYDQIEEITVLHEAQEFLRILTDDPQPYLTVEVKLKDDRVFFIENWASFSFVGYVELRKELPKEHKAHKCIEDFINGAIDSYFDYFDA